MPLPSQACPALCHLPASAPTSLSGPYPVPPLLALPMALKSREESCRDRWKLEGDQKGRVGGFSVSSPPVSLALLSAGSPQVCLQLLYSLAKTHLRLCESLTTVTNRGRPTDGGHSGAGQRGSGVRRQMCRDVPVPSWLWTSSWSQKMNLGVRGKVHKCSPEQGRQPVDQSVNLGLEGSGSQGCLCLRQGGPRG